MLPLSRFFFPRRARRLFCALGLALATSVLAAEPAKTLFDVPAGDAVATLRRAAQQAGVEIMFPVTTVSDVKTNAVKGEFTPREALDRMVAGTELLVVQDEKTGALAVKRAAGPNAFRAAPLETGDRPQQKSNIEDGTVKLDTVEVTGSRIRSLVGEQSIQPVLTVSSKDISRMGVNSLADVLRYIPQITSSNLGFPDSGANSGPAMFVGANRVSATLRNAPQGGTLLLINGRRAPKNGLEQGNEGYDLSGIPLAAIERIDVLLDGGSAVYGADAMGGVINVILKKHYQGSELRLGYDNTFDTDAAIRSVSFTTGFAEGKWSGLFTGSWDQSASLALRDRSFSASFDRRPFGGSDNRVGNPGGTGQITADDGLLPGLGVASVAIPAGSDGRHVTIADYANAGPIAAPYDLASFYDWSPPTRNRSVSGSLEYEHAPWLTAFAEWRWGDSESKEPMDFGMSFTDIPAGAPGNPFGVPIYVDKYFFDLPSPLGTTLTRNSAYTVGVRGDILGGWHYEGTASWVRSEQFSAIPVNTEDGIEPDTLDAAFASANPPVLLYDSTRGISYNPPGTVEALYSSYYDAERSDAWTYDFHADGPVFALPAGDVRIAVGGEYREEDATFPDVTADTAKLYAQPKNRYSTGIFAEARVPLVSSQQHWPFLDRAEVNLAARRDRYSDIGSAVTPRYGALLSPFKWLMFRGSYGRGFKAPTLFSLYQPVTVLPLRVSASAFDPLRNNESFGSKRLTVISGGRPELRPERAKNTTFGLVLEMPGVKGLSVSYDYWDNQYIDEIGSLAFDQRVLLFPQFFTRGPNLPGDQPGWPGPITGYDSRVVNIASARVTGYDITIDWNRSTRIGGFDFKTVLTQTTRNEFSALPNSPPSLTVSKDRLPLRLNGSLFWTRGAVDAGVLATFQGRQRFPSNPNWTPSSLRWDAKVSVDFSQIHWLSESGARWRRPLADMSLSLTIFNVFNREPPIAPGLSYFPDYSVLDARLRRYALQLTKRF